MQDGGIRLTRTSVGSEIDADCTEKRQLYFNGVLQDKWGSAETATDVRDCGYGRTMGTGTGVVRVQIQAYIQAYTLTSL